MRKLVAFISIVGALLFGAAPVLAAGSTNVSGNELFPGVPCTIGGVSAHCGDTFAGWTGGGGQEPGGWVPYPGTGGAWKAVINYTGTSGLGQTVYILPGGYWALKANGKFLTGSVMGGKVWWPASASSTSTQCGNSTRSGQAEPVGVATATMKVLTSTSPSIRPGATLSFNGCLDDQPASFYLNLTNIEHGILPRIWGVFSPT